MEVDGRVGETRRNIYIYIYQKGYQHGQAIQLLSMIMLHDLHVTVCVCSEGSALFHITWFLHPLSCSMQLHSTLLSQKFCCIMGDGFPLILLVPFVPKTRLG